MTRNARWTSRRHSRTARTTSSWGDRSARRATRARPPRRSRRRSRLFSRHRDELLEQALEVRMHGEERAVKEHLAVARHAQGGEVPDLEDAYFVGLVLDIDPAEACVRKLL